MAVLGATIVAGLLLALLTGGDWNGDIQICPDSILYHSLAVNLLAGKGYWEIPVGCPEDYDAETRRLFPDAIRELRERGDALPPSRPMSRGPVYPLFLTAVYAIHGVQPAFVLRYQIVLAAMTGAAMVLLGCSLWGIPGVLAGLVAVWVYGHSTQSQYPVSELLTEQLATFLLTAGALTVAWARRRGWRSEIVAAAVLCAATLCRPALVFVAVLYGLWLLVWRDWRRAIAFGLPCALLLGGWAATASMLAGRIILLADNGATNLVAGLDPEVASRYIGREKPALTEESMEAFWTCFPGHEQARVALQEAFTRLPSRWAEVGQLVYLKIKIGLFWIPRPLLALMLIGVAIAGSLGFSRGDLPSRRHVTVRLYPRGLLRARSILLGGAALAAFCSLLIALGYSHPGLQVFLLTLPATSLFAKIDFVATDREATKQSVPTQSWIQCWLWGYLAATVLTIAVQRFMRPYLPVLYLCGVVAVPLLAMVLLGLLNGSFHAARRYVFRWEMMPLQELSTPAEADVPRALAE